MQGHAVQIISSLDDHLFLLNEEVLESILLQENVKDKKVVVLSIAGAFRKGKSFFLDFCLRYLNSQGRPDWIGEENEPLTGFSWRGGAERDTSGILLWNQIFIVPLPSGEEVAVLLMDTQGAFDSVSTVKDCATIFALSTMTSSIQIFNLSQNIQENDLQHLQLFTEYGRLAMEDSFQCPFQKLVFLVRDWSFPYELEYGFKGGKEILERRLKISENQHSELQQLRKHIRSCFSEISCFLLPHPGLEVATNPHFDGKLAVIQKNFRDYLKVLIPMLLAPEKLVLKEVNGEKITCKELLEYFKAYVRIFQGDELPEPKTMLVATAEANNLAAVSVAKEQYCSAMEKVCGGTCPYVKSSELERHHKRFKGKAESTFKNTRKMGGEEFSQQYLERLQHEMESLYTSYAKQNESKNIFFTAKTPGTFFIVIILMYLCSGFFGLLGIYTMANFCDLVLGVALLTLCLWSYIRYSGDMADVGSQIDIVASFIWINILKPMYKTLLTDKDIIKIATGISANSTVNALTENGRLKSA